MRVIADIETNGLENPTRLWLIVAKDIDTGEVHVFREPDKHPAEFLKLASKITAWVGHNFLVFDSTHINNLVPGACISKSTVIDTLIVSRLLNYSIEDGHSLEAWGHRLGDHKIPFDEWDKLTEEMVTYCIQDVEVNYKLFKRFEPFITSPKWKTSLRLEHNIAISCEEMKINGFSFDITAAKALEATLSQEIADLDVIIQAAFPPRSVFIREINPKGTKHGTISRTDFRWLSDGDLSPYAVGCPFSRIRFDPFNPGSPSQIVDRLNLAGWRPFEKTKGHLQAERDQDEQKLIQYRLTGWKVSEANLKTLPTGAPTGARKLAERLIKESRRSDLEEWIKAAQPAYNQIGVCQAYGSPVCTDRCRDPRDCNGIPKPYDYRIHGSLYHIGAWTGRLSHSKPNTANIASVESDKDGHPIHGFEGGYGFELRSLWKAAPGKVLVGCDAKGIQLRVLAHYINDEKFTQEVLSGDVHALNQRALGPICKSRGDAKTFIYAWLLGAGVAKVAAILGCTIPQAKRANESFLEFYPGLKSLKRTDIPRDAALGYFRGFDGRYVAIESEYLCLAGYLQNGEAVIMKTACILWQDKLQYLGIPYKLVAWPHDEWQTEVNPEDAETVGKVQAEAIAEAGRILNLKCPMGGDYKIGGNWAETH